MPSHLVLPVIPDVTVPTDQPICPSLRNEPCRTFEASANLAGDTTLLATAPTPVVPEAPIAVLSPSSH